MVGRHLADRRRLLFFPCLSGWYCACWRRARLSPIATAVLSLVTLFGAVPIYILVARRSYAGQGSIALLENLLAGWWGKLLVLVLLGFAMTDFVITMTLSAADAARHATENPYLHPLIGDHPITITVVLLALLAAVFIAGFREAIVLALFVAVPYLLLNAVLLVKCMLVVAADPASSISGAAIWCRARIFRMC